VQPSAAEQADKLAAWEASGVVINTRLRAEIASTLRGLLPQAKKQAAAGKPALLRLIVRYGSRRAQ
jgi:hypothetical protein